MAGWTPTEKVYQLYRRRRWVRNRSVVKRKVYQRDEIKKVKFNYLYELIVKILNFHYHRMRLKRKVGCTRFYFLLNFTRKKQLVIE